MTESVTSRDPDEDKNEEMPANSEDFINEYDDNGSSIKVMGKNNMNTASENAKFQVILVIGTPLFVQKEMDSRLKAFQQLILHASATVFKSLTLVTFQTSSAITSQ